MEGHYQNTRSLKLEVPEVGASDAHAHLRRLGMSIVDNDAPDAALGHSICSAKDPAASASAPATHTA